jgi:hypothetical protein
MNGGTNMSSTCEIHVSSMLYVDKTVILTLINQDMSKLNIVDGGGHHEREDPCVCHIVRVVREIKGDSSFRPFYGLG